MTNVRLEPKRLRFLGENAKDGAPASAKQREPCGADESHYEETAIRFFDDRDFGRDGDWDDPDCNGRPPGLDHTQYVSLAWRWRGLCQPAANRSHARGDERQELSGLR